jgi:hypothetical protein
VDIFYGFVIGVAFLDFGEREIDVLKGIHPMHLQMVIGSLLSELESFGQELSALRVGGWIAAGIPGLMNEIKRLV